MIDVKYQVSYVITTLVVTMVFVSQHHLASSACVQVVLEAVDVKKTCSMIVLRILANKMGFVTIDQVLILFVNTSFSLAKAPPVLIISINTIKVKLCFFYWYFALEFQGNTRIIETYLWLN